MWLRPVAHSQPSQPHSYAQPASYSQAVEHLRAELEQKYELGNLDILSYALAVSIYCLAAVLPVRESWKLACVLAGRNCLGQYASANDVNFCSLAFHPAYRIFSSEEPPAFLSKCLLAIIKHNTSYLNEDANVVSCGYDPSDVSWSSSSRP